MAEKSRRAKSSQKTQKAALVRALRRDPGIVTNG
jgi:hypothetical protein